MLMQVLVLEPVQVKIEIFWLYLVRSLHVKQTNFTCLDHYEHQKKNNLYCICGMIIQFKQIQLKQTQLKQNLRNKVK